VRINPVFLSSSINKMNSHRSDKPSLALTDWFVKERRRHIRRDRNQFGIRRLACYLYAHSCLDISRPSRPYLLYSLFSTRDRSCLTLPLALAQER
jgi:hypothetical protein